MARVKQRGFTITEIIIGTSIGVLALGAAVGSSVAMTNVASKLTKGATTVKEGGNSLDLWNQDLRDADAILTQWPPTGTADFRTNETNTIIVRVPTGSVGNSSKESYDIFIYYWQSATGEDAPGKLTRYISKQNGTGAPKAKIDRVIATNVASTMFTYVCRETFFGDSNYKKFSLRSKAMGDKSNYTQTVYLDGTEMVEPGDAQINSDMVVFSDAPQYGKLIDTRYTVDPTEIVNGEQAVNANEVTISLQLSPTWRDKGHVKRARTIELTSRVRLRNRL